MQRISLYCATSKIVSFRTKVFQFFSTCRLLQSNGTRDKALILISTLLSRLFLFSQNDILFNSPSITFIRAKPFYTFQRIHCKFVGEKGFMVYLREIGFPVQ